MESKRKNLDPDTNRSILTDRSLDGIYKKHGAVAIDIVGKISEAVLRGLTYLYDEHRIIHRGRSAPELTSRSSDAITR
jgi:hypothetical protein